MLSNYHATKHNSSSPSLVLQQLWIELSNSKTLGITNYLMSPLDLSRLEMSLSHQVYSYIYVGLRTLINTYLSVTSSQFRIIRASTGMNFSLSLECNPTRIIIEFLTSQVITNTISCWKKILFPT